MRKTIRISKDTDDKIRAFSKEQGINQSQAVEVAVIYYLAAKEKEQTNG